MSNKIKLGIMIGAFLTVIAAAIITLGFLGKVNSDGKLTPAEPDYERILANSENLEKAIDFSMTDSSGKTVSLNEFILQGKPIVLNFWASWCPPCTHEMPYFDKVFLEKGGEVQFIMLNLAEPPHIGADFVKKNNFSFPVFFDTNEEGAYLYRITAIPLTLFINKDGYIAQKIPGSLSENTLRAGIELIL